MREEAAELWLNVNSPGKKFIGHSSTIRKEGNKKVLMKNLGYENLTLIN